MAIGLNTFGLENFSAEIERSQCTSYVYIYTFWWPERPDGGPNEKSTSPSQIPNSGPRSHSFVVVFEIDVIHQLVSHSS